MARKKEYIVICSLLRWISFVYIFQTNSCLSLNDLALKEFQGKCPSIDPQVHEDSVLAGAREAGNYVPIPNATDMLSCTHSCCMSENCHIALIHNGSCVNLECKSETLCKIIQGTGSDVVKVRNIAIKSMTEEARSNNATIENSSKVKSGRTTSIDRRCEVGLLECSENEKCVPLGGRHRNGLCQCVSGYQRNNSSEKCVADDITTISSEMPITQTITNDENETKAISLTTPSTTTRMTLLPVLLTDAVATTITGTTTPKPVEKLVVSVNNKTVYLTAGSQTYEERVTLSAYAIGDSSDNKYEWVLLEKPKTDDTGILSDANSQTITLSHLVEGVYTFKVHVGAPGAHGEAVGNVTVLPPKRINQPPKAVIVPPSQVIKLPNSGVIIDGSSSTDDGGISSYHWEMVSAPLGYKLSEEAGSTLQLTDLIAGNYTIMLLVKDEEGLEGNTTTFLNVVKETDYRPTANAGGDQIVYLPQTEITLYGNASTDDHGIVEWEWTKGPKDSGKAVDMQDTRTPFLHLSNLEEGHYQFILRVTDSSSQSSESYVAVFVKKPSMNIPRANAGEDLSLVIPNKTVVLDGSQSTDISTNTHWLWKLISGPSTVHFSVTDAMRVNVSDLTKGEYVFMLTTWNGDDSAKNSSDSITVSVIQDQNVAPKANAGGDFSVTLPVSVVVVNGSKSSDDVAVTNWKWQRDPTSLAAGTIINSSDTSPVLMFTDVVAGVYVWKLTVWDYQGASSSDTVSIIVKENSHHLDEVELLVRGDIGKLSYTQLTTLLQKLELFLHTSDRVVSIHLISLNGIPHSGHVRLSFLAYAGKNVVKGPEVVNLLRHQVNPESSELLDFPLLSVDTVVCQNNCSGHGECIQSSRECRCQTWWMESFTRRHMGDGIQNCDWSVVYVFVTICVVALATGLSIWGLIALLVRKFGSNTRPRRKPPRYSLLDTHEENIKHSKKHKQRKKSQPPFTSVKTHVPNSLLDSGSESESDAEVLFDSRKAKHKSDKQRNGYQKLARIRT